MNAAPLRTADFARDCLAFARRDLALLRSYGASTALGLAAGVLGLVSYYFIGRLVGKASPLPGGDYFAFVCTGMCVQVCVAAALGALGGALARESREGTLEPALAAGASPLAVVAGGALAPLLLAAGQALLYLAAGAVLLDVDLSGARPLTAAAGLLATVVASASIGLLGAAAWVVIRRPGAVTTAAAFAFGVLGGVYFPVDLLPAPLDRAAPWLPITAGVDLVRSALLGGAGARDVLAAGARLAAITLATLPPSLLVLRWALRRAQRAGTLAHV